MEPSPLTALGHPVAVTQYDGRTSKGAATQREEYTSKGAATQRASHTPTGTNFELRLRNHLKSRIGSAGTLLLYVIRLREDGDVGDEQRNWTVGQGPTDAYGDWIDYTTRCTVHSGDHILSDDARVWSILYSLVAPGPGWNYIKNHDNKDGAKGNARAAFLELRQQAHNTTNIEQIAENELRFMRESTYDASESSNSYNFENTRGNGFLV